MEKRFADVIKFTPSWRHYPGSLEWALNVMTSVFIKREAERGWAAE